MSKHESGQAFMELTIMLLILTAMILAVVIISGLEITSNTMLLSARNNAQKSSRDGSTMHSVKADEIYNWSYTNLNLTDSYIHPERKGSFGNSVTLLKYQGKRYRLRSRGDGTLQIPFSYQGSSSINSGEISLKNANFAVTSAFYTRPQTHDYEKFTNWKPLSGFDSSLQHDYTENVRDGNAFNAAKLVVAEGDTSERPATLSPGAQAGEFSRGNAMSVMYRSFRDIFGVDLNDIKLRSHETNRVYMPAL